MTGRILLPGEIGAAIAPRLTLDGLRDLLGEMRRRGERMPVAIIVSETERRDLNQELLGASEEAVAKEDQRPEHDGRAIGIVDGVMIRSHPEVPVGKARLVYPPVKDDPKPLPSGKLYSIGAM